MNLLYLNVLIHIGILFFVFSLFYAWKKKGFEKPFTQDNWLKLTVFTIAVLPFSFIVIFLELSSPSTEYLTQGEIEWCAERNIRLVDCEDSWPLK